MDFQIRDQNVENGKTNTKQQIHSFEHALELTGDGPYKYLVIFVNGINLLAGFIVSLILSYVLPSTGCDLNLSTTEKGTLTATLFIGMVFSSHLFGYLSDTYGRRYVIVRANIICAILCVLASLAPSAKVLAILWFAIGFVVAGSLTPLYVLACEFSSLKNRTDILLICSAIASLSSTYLACVAWLVMPLPIKFPIIGTLYYTSWRLYTALGGIPLIIGCITMIFLPESPRFLLSKGRKVETLYILKSIFAVNNNKHPNEYPVVDIYLDEDGEETDLEKDEGFFKTMVAQTCLLFKRPLLKYILISCTFQFFLGGAYNIMLLWLPENINNVLTYEMSNPTDKEITFCNILTRNFIEEDVQMKLLNNSDNVINDTMYSIDQTCDVSINMDIYLVNIIIGIVQFVVFTTSTKIADIIGRKPIIVISLVVGSVCSVLVTVLSIKYTAILLGSVTVLVSAMLPVIYSIVIDYFPTHIRGMATCISMTFGRFGASIGCQLFGILQSRYCDDSYYILAGALVCMGIASIKIPIKK